MADSAGDNKNLSGSGVETKQETQIDPQKSIEIPTKPEVESKSQTMEPEKPVSVDTQMEVDSSPVKQEQSVTEPVGSAITTTKTQIQDSSQTVGDLKTILESKCKGDCGCHCGKSRKLGTSEVQCGICFKFFHVDCLSSECRTKYQNEIKVVPFSTSYTFFCKKCTRSGCDSFYRKQATFKEMCVTAIANLLLQTPQKRLFSKDLEIIPYIDAHWTKLTTIPRHVQQTWHKTVYKTMMKEPDTFTINEDNLADPKFGLVSLDLERLAPNYDAMFKAPNIVTKPAESLPRVEPKPDMLPLQTKTRGTKRKNPDTQTSAYGPKAKKGEVLSTKVAPSGYPAEHPHNKDGYRYILAEPDPHAPNREAFDTSIEWAGKPIPGYLYRTWLETHVQLALHDRAPQLKVMDDRMGILSGEKGYCMCRATHGVGHGAWYFEVTVNSMPNDTATRIGWSQSLGNLQAPCGYDKFSYSWRSRKGTVFHQSRGKHYADEGYGEDDVLGFYICLPQPDDKSKLLPKTSKDKPLVKFKSHLYFEEKDYVSDVEKNLKPAVGSKMMMYKNGVNQGVAFEDVFEGIYYPALSVYKTASVAVNFGPKFKYPPKDQGEFRPISDAAHEAVIEHALSDIMYHVQNEGQFPEF